MTDARLVAAHHHWSASKLAAWLREDLELLAGVAFFRRAGLKGADLVARALALPDLKCLPASWELWQAMAEDDGIDVDRLLGEYLPADVISVAREAVWGVDPAASRGSCHLSSYSSSSLSFSEGSPS